MTAQWSSELINGRFAQAVHGWFLSHCFNGRRRNELVYDRRRRQSKAKKQASEQGRKKTKQKEKEKNEEEGMKAKRH